MTGVQTCALPISVLHIADQPQIRNELMGGETADLPDDPVHQSAQAHKGIVCGNGGEMPGEENFMGDLHIQEAGVIHQNQARFIFTNALHSFLCVSSTATCKAEPSQYANKRTPEHIGLDRLLSFRPGFAHSDIKINLFKRVFQ